jgi:hypothetical protein
MKEDPVLERSLRRQPGRRGATWLYRVGKNQLVAYRLVSTVFFGSITIDDIELNRSAQILRKQVEL